MAPTFPLRLTKSVNDKLILSCNCKLADCGVLEVCSVCGEGDPSQHILNDLGKKMIGIIGWSSVVNRDLNVIKDEQAKKPTTNGQENISGKSFDWFQEDQFLVKLTLLFSLIFSCGRT